MFVAAAEIAFVVVVLVVVHIALASSCCATRHMESTEDLL